MSVSQEVGAGLAVTPPRPTFNKRNSLERARQIDRLMTGVMWASWLFLALILLAVIVLLLIAGWPTLSWEFLTTSSNYSSGGGIGPILWVTLFTLLFSLLISVPLGIAAAIYMQEYALPGRFTNVIRFILVVV